jgi:hypothetical protein
MKGTHVVGAVAVTTLLALFQSDGFETRSCANGLAISARTHAKADVQWFGLYLPTGVLDEAAGAPGWSVLALQAMLLNEDPEAGERDHPSTRGDVLPRAALLAHEGDSKKLELLLEFHQHWLAAGPVNRTVFEAARKKAIEALGDASSVRVQRLLSLCAWNQVARHDVTAVKLRASLAQAKPEEVERWVRGRLARRAPRLATVGPRTVTDARTAAERALGKIALPTEDAAAAPEPAALSAEPRTIDATWDLASPHLLEWYVIPCDEPQDHVAAMVLASCLQDVVNDQVDESAVLAILAKKDHAMTDVSSFALSPEQHVLLFSTHVPKDGDASKWIGYPRELFARLTTPGKGEQTLSERFTEHLSVYSKPLEIKKTEITSGALSLSIDITPGASLAQVCKLELESGVEPRKMYPAAKMLSSTRVLALATQECAPERASRARLQPVPAPAGPRK